MAKPTPTTSRKIEVIDGVEMYVNRFTGEKIPVRRRSDGMIITDKRAMAIANMDQSAAGRASAAKPGQRAQLARAQQRSNTPEAREKAVKTAKRTWTARALRDVITSNIGQDVLNGYKNAAKVAAGKVKGHTFSEQLSALKQCTELIVSGEKTNNRGGVVNNVLIQSESAASEFLAHNAGRGREMVAVPPGRAAGDEGGAHALPVGVSGGRAFRDVHPEGSGGADEVAARDSGAGRNKPGATGGTDDPPA